MTVKPSVQENVPLAPFTTLGVGGPAHYFCSARTEADVIAAVDFARASRFPLFVLGGGSNLLISDRGFPGVVLRIEIEGIDWIDDGKCVRLSAGAGEEWDRVVDAACERELSGLECLSGIAGSVGGTPVQNVGAYGQEVAETIVSVRVLDQATDRIFDLPAAECSFRYRSSIFNGSDTGKYIVLAVRYRLGKHGEPALRYAELQREFDNVAHPSLLSVRQAVRRIRARKGMLIQADDPDSRSAGSFFKNPVLTAAQFDILPLFTREQIPVHPAGDGRVKVAAAWLIEHSGMGKGYGNGPAGISGKHSLAIVNRGGATANDIVMLAKDIRTRVHDHFGITLMPEPVCVGDFGDSLRCDPAGFPSSSF